MYQILNTGNFGHSLQLDDMKHYNITTNICVYKVNINRRITKFFVLGIREKNQLHFGFKHLNILYIGSSTIQMEAGKVFNKTSTE